MSKVYINLGIPETDILELQKWLFPIIVDRKLNSISDIIIRIKKKYPVGDLRNYAFYILGYHIGGARVYEKLGKQYIIDPEVT